MGLSEGESLPGSERQTAQAYSKLEDDDVMGTYISGRNMLKYFCFEEMASFSHGGRNKPK